MSDNVPAMSEIRYSGGRLCGAVRYELSGAPGARSSRPALAEGELW